MNQKDCIHRVNGICDILECECSDDDVIRNNPENFRNDEPIMICELYEEAK